MDLPQTKLTENTFSSFAGESRQRIAHKNTFSYNSDQKKKTGQIKCNLEAGNST
jgi:hypothetical protein